MNTLKKAGYFVMAFGIVRAVVFIIVSILFQGITGRGILTLVVSILVIYIGYMLVQQRHPLKWIYWVSVIILALQVIRAILSAVLVATSGAGISFVGLPVAVYLAFIGGIVLTIIAIIGIVLLLKKEARQAALKNEGILTK